LELLHSLIQENVPLAPLTTLGIGGPARFLAEARDEAQVFSALEFAHDRSCPVFVLGGGSNLVISDEGFRGLVLRVALCGLHGPDAAKIVSAAAGEPWDAFVGLCVDQNLAGIECLSGIPGCVGGAPIQNVGAYGQEVSEVITSVRVLDRSSGEITQMANSECGFGYRMSVFNTRLCDRYIVLAVDFALRRGGAPRVAYADLHRYFERRAAPPALAEVRAAVLEIRASKAMVLKERDPDSRSVGSFFKNPVVTAEDALRVEDSARGLGRMGNQERLPAYPGTDGGVKLSAAWLIERAGFHKGYGRGSVGISTRHSLALVNRGGATARELLQLAAEIRSGVQATFGIRLVPEPVFVGFPQDPLESSLP
jgi:UDP-N-acetylmuramate dehydrogenase